MKNWEQNLVSDGITVKQALERLNKIGIASNVLFVVDNQKVLKGSVTDGDIRRGLLNNADVRESVTAVMNKNCRRISKNVISTELLADFRKRGISTLPVVNATGQIVDILDLSFYKGIVPASAILMAGGRGERLLPLTKDTPKPLLPVNGKPIIEHNIDRLISFGVHDIYISINYLGNQIEERFGDGAEKGISINYIRETTPLGTIGSVSLGGPYTHDSILLMNSDLLTNIDFGDFYAEFQRSGADMAVATVAHHVDLPYAIMELSGDVVCSLREKPRYTYFANSGIYLFKKELLSFLPPKGFYNATDLMERVISEGKRLIHFPLLGYWLDIGRMNDYHKAQEDFKHIIF
ncbi:MAG: nucleotidyltransferase family protein [Bacteroidota bacterium]|nr:nucleotidyltransferase family protein [Bacteroidota bacterium]